MQHPQSEDPRRGTGRAARAGQDLSDAARPRNRRGMPWWLPALTFLAGRARGVSAFAVSPPQAPDGSAAAPRPTASAAPTPAPTGNPPSVTAPCLAVADHAEEMLQELNRA